MRSALVGLSLLFASGDAWAQMDAMKAPAQRQGTDAARPAAAVPAKPLTPQGPPAAPGATDAKPAASTTRSKATRGGADSGPSGQTEDEVYIGARAKAPGAAAKPSASSEQSLPTVRPQVRPPLERSPAIKQ